MHPSNQPRERTLRDLAMAARFGLVGLAATGTHMLALLLFCERTALPLLLSNTLAFLVAFGISFGGHYFWTFRSPGAPLRAAGRFFVIAGIAFLCNTLTLLAVNASGFLSPFHASLAAIFVIPPTTYIASRLWGFPSAQSSRAASR